MTMKILTDDETRTLVQSAREARRWAYAPYSGYAVGAALYSDSGRIYNGVNVENAAYPAGKCAERVSVFKAVPEGERRFTAISVVTKNGGTPCGACRQVLAEFGLETLILVADEDGEIVQETSISAMLPEPFGSEDLKTE